AALPRVPQRNHRRFECAACRGPAPSAPRADASRQERRRNHEIHDGSLQRLRALQAAARAAHVAVVGGAGAVRVGRCRRRGRRHPRVAAAGRRSGRSWVGCFVTVSVLVCAAMIAAALLWILLPLWRRADADEAPSVRERGVASVVVALAVPAIAVAMYGMLSNWKWDEAQRQQEQTAQLDGMLRQLEDRLKSNPNDLNGWLLLGRSYATMGRYPLAVDAYQQAYDLSKGENIEATIGLGEALFFTDQASLGGRAGQLFEDALARAPNHPKALWYGSIAALHAGDLVRGRDRLKLLAAQNPPQEIQAVLQRQIQDLDEQIAAAGGAPMSGGEGSQSAAAPGRSIDVAV